MPLKQRDILTGDEAYASPFVGPVEYTHQIAVNITAMTNKEVDADGFLKPGVPLREAGVLVTTNAQVIFGVTIEPLKVANGNAAGDLSAADATHQIAVATIGQISKARVEQILDRALTANELLAFAAAGCTIKLLA
jgi:hypothetical protein